MMGILLSPRQLSYGVRNGAEAAVHAARLYLQRRQTCHLWWSSWTSPMPLIPSIETVCWRVFRGWSLNCQLLCTLHTLPPLH